MKTIIGSLASAYFLTTAVALAAPHVPAFEHLKASGASADEQGRALIRDLNCVACHKADLGEGQLAAKQAPNLAEAGTRLTPQFIRAFLSDPHGVRPGTSMPTIFHASAPQAKTGAVEALTHYLVSLGGPIKPSKSGGSKVMLDAGKKLYHEIGCVACHAPEGKESELPSVPLGGLASKTTVDQLTAFLKNPSHARPSGRMPNLRLDDEQAMAIAVYLLREQLDNPQTVDAAPASKPGVAYRYYEGKNYIGKEAELEKAKPKSKGVVPNFSLGKIKHKKDNVAFVFEAAIEIKKEGEYKFFTTSDDSSFLWIDGKKIVDNGGAHGMVEKNGKVKLSAGAHAIKVVMAQGGGGMGLKVAWQPPGGKKGAIPNGILSATGGKPMIPLNSENFVVDAGKARMGKTMFSAMRCVQCHEVPGVQPMPRPIPTLAALKGKSGSGCLSTAVPKGKPNYGLSADQRQALAAALKTPEALSKPISEVKQAQDRIAAFNCVACHEHDGHGGPGARGDYFKQKIQAELGDEGRLPPTLTGIGGKLKPEALAGIVIDGKHHVRPYMATRMPSFGHAEVAKLTKLLSKVDAKPGDSKEPVFSKESIAAGRKLVGTTGLGCVNCHNLAGNKSLGVPAVDLATVHARLKPAWLSRFLDNPAAINKGTRMPAFWLNGVVAFKDIAGGNAEAQQDAIWNYLALGDSMPLPTGIGGSTKGNELVPGGNPILIRTFVEHAGPRGIAVGFPERLHVSFDANLVRMTNAWKGQFFDPFGAWSGRNMKFHGPMGQNVLNMPPGPSFAALATPETAWPALDPKKDRRIGHFKGYRFDKERIPIFIYQQDGLRIEEQAKPELQKGGAALIRRFQVTGDKVPSGFHFIAAAGKSISAKDQGSWQVEDGPLVTITAPGMSPFVRSGKNGKELLVPLALTGNTAKIEVKVQW